MCGILCIISYGGTIDQSQYSQCLKMLKPRGPDNECVMVYNDNSNVNVYMGFQRLAIMDTSDAGLQPFDANQTHVICNGEIYGYKQLVERHNIQMQTVCDCELILPLYRKVGFLNLITKKLDAEFAMVLYDEQKKVIYAARDRYGVRPLFYGYNSKIKIIGFASEMKALHTIMEYIAPMKPNEMATVDLSRYQSCLDSIKFTPYYDYNTLSLNLIEPNTNKIQPLIRKYLINAVSKRLMADRPIGFLLSGGLDSSLIVAIATKLIDPKKIVCFSIGLVGSPDVEAAKKVVNYLGITHHHIIPFSVSTGIKEIPNVIRAIESYDITTIRASTPQYIMAEYIQNKTDIRVLLSGEGSDEIHGSYRYFRDAPNANDFHCETIRLLEELYMFDNLRTDRTMAAHGLEVRVPFLDFKYVEFIKQLNPALLMHNSDIIEKKIIRDSFVDYLPNEILYRSKEAFSDAVSSNEVNWFKSIQSKIDAEISDDELKSNQFHYNKPETKEALYYRKIYDSIYPHREIFSHYWLPRFQKEKVFDPSATILQCY